MTPEIEKIRANGWRDAAEEIAKGLAQGGFWVGLGLALPAIFNLLGFTK